MKTPSDILTFRISKALSFFAVLFCLLFSSPFFAGAQSSPTKPDTLDNKSFVNWAKGHAFTLQNTDNAVGYNDLLPIKKMIGNARVVAVGEAAHGMHEPQAFRNRLFKYLVEECGFTTIVVEAGLAESTLANTFVLTGKGSPQIAAKNLTIGNASSENIELMQWMRKYNLSPAHKNKLKFLGMDVEIVGYPGDTIARHVAIDTVLNYLKKVDSEASAKISTVLLPYINRLSTARYPALTQIEHSQLTAILESMTALIERQRINYLEKSSKDEYEWVHRLAIAAQQTERIARLTPQDQSGGVPPDAWMASDARDAAMAANVIWILNNRANGKVLLYSHNAHVKNAPTTGSVWSAFAQAPNTVGQYLKSILGKDYFIVGTSFAPSVAAAQPGSVDLALLDVGKPRFIVSLKEASINPRVKNWLAVKRPMEANMHFFFNLQIGTAFDALLLLDKSSPAK